MSNNGRMDKANVIDNSMEYHSTFKKEEILSYATTWIHFEDIMVSEIRQS